MGMSEYKSSNNKWFRYILVVINNSSKYTWSNLLKNTTGQSVPDEFSNNLSSSKPKLNKIESDWGAET